ncbi:hypothetical protein B0H16DRAFT_1790241 [Mycena metata]|uniref:Peptidase A1 domain-containing protein n=1 Tax=Mycena metata TaxID=1033252 RepID=A0AAD7MKL9_9AGAR|nr:hypothetical protein B0H16DRAFT_1790241 [Mycena metata]
MGVRLRYLARHHLILPSSVGAVFSSDGLLQSTSAYKVAPPSARPSVATPSSVTVHADHVATPSFIPVHADRGPDPARNAESPDELLTTTTTMKVFGPYREVVGKLVRNSIANEEQQRSIEAVVCTVFDLGSSDLWVYGQELRTTASCPHGAPGHPPLFWFPRNADANEQLGDGTCTVNYVDGTFAKYKLWTDYIYLRPYWGPLPGPHFRHSWIGSKNVRFSLDDPLDVLTLPKRFRQCIEALPVIPSASTTHLESPEMTILLGRNFGYITFGRRPVLSGPNTGDWHNCIPILGDEHWMFSSCIKKLNGIEYISSNGTAELDTGTTFCYVGDDFVSAHYAQIPGSTTKFLGPQTQHLLYHLIPMTVGKTTPRVEFDIGGSMFILKHSHLPKGSKELAEATNYYVGALQHQSLLNGPGGAYNGPDIIGRVSF